MCNSSEEGNTDHGGKWKRISKHTGNQADSDDMLQQDTRKLNVNIGSAIKVVTELTFVLQGNAMLFTTNHQQNMALRS
jgi:hypothetical protein